MLHRLIAPQRKRVVLNAYFVLYRYNEDGHVKGIPEFKPPKPMRLQWELQDPAIEAIDRAYEVRSCDFSGLCTETI